MHAHGRATVAPPINSGDVTGGVVMGMGYDTEDAILSHAPRVTWIFELNNAVRIMTSHTTGSFTSGFPITSQETLAPFDANQLGKVLA